MSDNKRHMKTARLSFLSPLEQRRLVAAAQRRDHAARERLVTAFQPLVTRIARAEARGNAELERDLVQEGNIALLEAIESYAPGRGAWAAWAELRVRRATHEYEWAQRTLGGLAIRVPRSAWRQLAALQQAQQTLAAAGVRATEAALATELGWSPSKVADLLALQGVSAAQLEDEQVADAEEEVEGLAEALEGALDSLPCDLRAVLAGRYGLGRQTASEAELAEELGVPVSRVAGLHRRGLARLASSPILRAHASQAV